MKNPLIINLFGGPGSGKSTARAGIFNILKKQNISCEEASEWIKHKVYEGNTYVPKDQIYVFAKQNKLLREIGNVVDVIITDSPLISGILYDSDNNIQLRNLIYSEFEKFNNMNFFLNRMSGYDPVGRYQDYESAKKIDEQTKNLLISKNYKFTEVDVKNDKVNSDNDAEKLIAKLILKQLNKIKADE